MSAAPGAFPRQLEALRGAAAYPHATGTIELVETHVSWVLLTGEYAYKLKRPVRYDFIDLRDPAERERCCHEELRLNRRFAAPLYVDVCPVTLRDGRACMGGEGEVIDHAVRMRQFDRADALDALLDRDAATAEELQAFGQSLARIHEDCPVASGADRWGTVEEVRTQLLRNLEQAAEAGGVFDEADAVRGLRPALEHRLRELADVLGKRREDGRVRECHGDLHTRNVVRIGQRLMAFDCLEFQPAFRWIDVADEVALLRVDLARRGRRDLAQAFITGYLRGSGDYGLCRVLPLYEAHRALVRAKVAAVSARAGVGDAAAMRAEHDALLRVAHEALASRQGRLVLVTGVSGSGKSWLSSRLALAGRAMWVNSDVERKRLAGLQPEERSGSPAGAGIYTRAMTDRTYARLADCAREVLAGGFDALVDATFQRARDRARFAALAARMQVPLRVIVCEAELPVLHQRLAERARRGDVSEADAGVLRMQLEQGEPVRPDEGLDVVRVRTGDEAAVAALLCEFAVS